MCRELRREPAWVAAIRLAVLRGEVDVAAVIHEANLVDGMERTVEDVLSTMAERDLLREAPDHAETGRYLVGSVLLQAAPQRAAGLNSSSRAVHRWGQVPSD